MTGDKAASLREEQIQGWVDGRLDANEADEVEAARAADPELRARLDGWRRQREALALAMRPQGDGTVPARLSVDRMAIARAARNRRQGAIAAAILIAALSAGGGWLARDLSEPALPSLAEADLPGTALSAHKVYSVEVRHAVEVGAGEEEHLGRWLSKRLGHAMPIADLTAEGFRLVGGRLLADGGIPAAQYMYEDDSGLRLTLYATARAGGGETAFRTVSDGDALAFYWRDPDLGYALVGELPRNRLLKIARVVYSQIEYAAR